MLPIHTPKVSQFTSLPKAVIAPSADIPGDKIRLRARHWTRTGIPTVVYFTNHSCFFTVGYSHGCDQANLHRKFLANAVDRHKLGEDLFTELTNAAHPHFIFEGFELRLDNDHCYFVVKFSPSNSFRLRHALDRTDKRERNRLLQVEMHQLSYPIRIATSYLDAMLLGDECDQEKKRWCLMYYEKQRSMTL